MNLISVRAVAGRVARETPRGKLIPHDRYVNVADTPYIQRLLNEWGDIEVEPAKPAPKAPKADPLPPVAPKADPLPPVAKM